MTIFFKKLNQKMSSAKWRRPYVDSWNFQRAYRFASLILLRILKQMLMQRTHTGIYVTMSNSKPEKVYQRLGAPFDILD